MSNTPTKTTNDVIAKLPELYALMIADYNKFMNGESEIQAKMRDDFAKSLTHSVGKNYIKILHNGATHGFIVINPNDKQFKFGDLLKAASWAQPAKNFSRGNIFNLEACKRYIKWTGI